MQTLKCNNTARQKRSAACLLRKHDSPWQTFQAKLGEALAGTCAQFVFASYGQITCSSKCTYTFQQKPISNMTNVIAILSKFKCVKIKLH